MQNKETKLSVFYTSLNVNAREKMHSDHLVAYLSSKDFQNIHGTRSTALGNFNIAFYDINQLLSKNKKGDIRQHLIEYYGLKKIDGEVKLPQLVLNSFKVVKKPHEQLKRLKSPNQD